MLIINISKTFNIYADLSQFYFDFKNNLLSTDKQMKESCKYLLSQVSAEGVFPTLSIIGIFFFI